MRKILAIAALSATVALAQDSQGQQSPSSPPQWALGPIEFSGLVDAYYSLNFNHPASRTNTLRNFDFRANQFSLNMAKLEMQHAPDPVGFRIDLGFGRAWDLFHFAEPKDALPIMRNIPQAYISVAPPKWGGFQVDIGKFYTSAGAELTENHLTWSYSRALLYANGPYYHFGIRTSKPLTKWWTAGVQLVNGWNNVEDNNTGKTIGLTSAMTSKKVSWYNTYYVGPEKTATNKGIRHFWDTVLNLNPSDQASFYVNFDYGVDKKAVNSGPDNDWWGIAFAHRYAVNDWFALSPRVEYYKDSKGFITGTEQALKEFTMTAEFKMKENFITRLEYRRDWSDKPFYDRGNELANAKNMSTLTLGFIAYFAPKK
ncbi:MAG: porin [Bryobacteraceae bacterium]|nr:porin [Bryobacteraceae bacterium]